MGALFTLIGTLLSIIIPAVTTGIGVAQSKKAQRQAHTQDILDFGKSLVAAEVQDRFNQRSAARSYEYETDYQGRMNKLTAAGLTNWAAAEALTGSSTTVQPSSIQVNQGRHQPFDLGALNALSAIPQAADKMIDREQQKLDNKYRDAELEIRRKALKIQEDLANNRISIDTANQTAKELVQGLLVENPLDPDGEKIPLLLATAIQDYSIGQESLYQSKTASSMGELELMEYHKEVERRETLFEWQLTEMADRHNLSDAELKKAKYAIEILKKESSKEWLDARYELLNAQALRAKSDTAIDSILDGLDTDADTKKWLKVGLKILKYLFGRR